mmetsp:Transcript_4788/g.16492  ORF Transcript_4788/g.16492 Transcript_4788/m.16492 type:complete len:219 (+) Transcript_4788:2884-3540(+)
MLTNFSSPMSAPNPASVTTNPPSPTSLSATLSATMELLPCAMLANGPACTSTGVPSSVCISVGWIASFIITHRAPPMPRSSAVMGSSALDVPTTMLPSRSRMSRSDVVSASTAMISEATVMSNPVWRVYPFSAAPSPTVSVRRKRSFVSTTRRHVILSGSKSRRANADFSASVSVSGSVLSIPSFFRRFSITLAKLRLPCLLAGQRRLKSASSFCVLS